MPDQLLPNKFTAYISNKGILDLKEVPDLKDFVTYWQSTILLEITGVDHKMVGNAFQLNGQMQLFGASNPFDVVLTVQELNTELQIVLSGEFPEDWNIKEAFGTLPGSRRVSNNGIPGGLGWGDSVISTLGISKASFKVASHADAGVKKGINIFADLAAEGGFLQVFHSWIPITGNLKLQGTVVLADNQEYPEIDFNAAITSPPIELLHFVLLPQVFEISTIVDENSFGAESQIVLVSEVTIPKTPNTDEIKFTLEAKGVELPDAWEFDIRPENDKKVYIGEGLDALTGLAGFPINVDLPDQFNILQKLFIKSFFLSLNPVRKHVFVATIVVGLGDHWSVIKSDKPGEKDVLTIEDPAFGLTILSPADSNRLLAPFVTGTFAFETYDEKGIQNGTIHLDVEADALDGYTLLAQLREGDQINIANVVRKWANFENLPNLVFNQLFISASTSGDLILSADAQEGWGIKISDTKSFVLKETKFYLEKSGDFLGWFTGYFIIAGVWLYLKVTAKESGKEWQFDGGVPSGQSIPMGTLIGDFETYFGINDNGEKVALENFIINKLDVHFTLPSKQFTFTCSGQFKADSAQVDNTAKSHSLVLSVNIIPGKSGFTAQFQFLFDKMEFDIIFDKSATTKILVATYHSTDGDKIDVQQVVSKISSEVGQLIPEGFSITLQDAVFNYDAEQSVSNFLFGISLAASLNLSNLPLVGKILPKNDTLGVNNLQLLIASADFKTAEVAAINGLLQEAGVNTLPTGGKETRATDTATETPAPAAGSAGTTTTAVALSKGFHIAADLQLGLETKLLSLPGGNAEDPSSPPVPAGSTPVTPAGSTSTPATTDKTKWFKVQKNFGPIHFDKVGVLMANEPNPAAATKPLKAIRFLLTAGMDIGPLSFTLDGLYLGMPISDFNPKTFSLQGLEFGLHGLGLDFQAGPLEIGGTFLRVDKADLAKDLAFEFDGGIIIGFKTLSLKAIGSYAKFTSGDPSLFIFGVLDYPLGGPPFLFVTGLAAGFGYNRQLQIPGIDTVQDFPLIKQARPGGSVSVDTIRSYIPPRLGQYFFAAGIQFSSFKLVEAQALITVSFGHSFELDLLGMARVVEPPTDDPDAFHLAVVELAIKVAYIADRGLLEALAQLTAASYVLSKDCHLTGGFAFYTWFKDDKQTGALAGDFVLSIGGYHPEYNKPDFYPTVPILGFNWKLTDSIQIKGGMYFALVPTAVMAGGYLSATYTSDHLKAWFDAGADFLISWKPYHYDIRVHIHVGGTATFWLLGEQTITLQLGADLHVWGPDFQGTAMVDLFIISIPIDFSTSANTLPDPISWEKFKTSFLPVDTDVITVAVGSGLVGTVKGNPGPPDIWIIDPKDFSLVIDSVVPLRTANVNAMDNSLITGHLLPQSKSTSGEGFGVAAMQQLAGNITSDLSIVATGDVSGLAFLPITKNVPAALWGDQFLPDVNNKKFIENALTGFTVKPGPPLTTPHTSLLDQSALSFTPNPLDNAFQWNDGFTYNAVAFATPTNEQVSAVSKLLDDLGYPALDITMTTSLFGELVDDPIMAL